MTDQAQFFHGQSHVACGLPATNQVGNQAKDIEIENFANFAEVSNLGVQHIYQISRCAAHQQACKDTHTKDENLAGLILAGDGREEDLSGDRHVGWICDQFGLFELIDNGAQQLFGTHLVLFQIFFSNPIKLKLLRTGQLAIVFRLQPLLNHLNRIDLDLKPLNDGFSSCLITGPGWGLQGDRKLVETILDFFILFGIQTFGLFHVAQLSRQGVLIFTTLGVDLLA